MANIGSAYLQIIPTAQGISGAISNMLGEEGKKGGDSAGNNFASKFVGIAKKLIAGAAIGKVFKDSLEAGGALQQSFGGLDTIYGEASEAAKQYAYEAAKAGISANDYAEQAVSFGASLKQAFGGDTVKAAEAANTAIMDMADNSAKFGTDIGAVQSAYQGFAKQNYTMLDNLKLGYGGTKTEMERLLKDAQALSGVEYNIDNLGDVYDAIHVIQEELGVAGVAAEEAGSTLSGSAAAMKAAWQNVLADLALGNDITASLEALADSASSFLFTNLLPMIGNIINQIPPLVVGMIGQIGGYSEEFVSSGIDIIMSMVNGLMNGFPLLVEAIAEFCTVFAAAVDSFDWVGIGSDLLKTIVNGIQVLAPVLWRVIQSLFATAVKVVKQIDWKGLGSTVLNYAIDGLKALGALLWNTLKNLFNNAKEGAKNINWQQLGRDVITFAINGLVSIGSRIGSTLVSLGRTALNAARNINWISLGRNIINGIVSGLRAAGGAVKEFLLGIARGALDAVKSFFGIHSPSKVMAQEVGKWIPLGIAKGIEDNAYALADSMNELSKEATASIDGSQMALDAMTGSNQLTTTSTVNSTPDRGMLLRLDAMLELMAEYYPEMAKDKGTNINAINRALGLELI